MKTVLEKTLSGACAAMLLAVAALSAPACSDTLDPGSGETHFLGTCAGACGQGFECLCGVCTKRCDGTGDACEALGGGATCETCAGKSVCDRVCTEDDECTALGDSFVCKAGRCREPAPPATDGGGPCPPRTVPLVGRPVNDCVEELPDPVPAAWTVACLPEDNIYDQGVEFCHKRVADGSVWLFTAGRVSVDGVEWEDCSEEQRAASLVGCNFSACESPPASTCSTAATCDEIGCGGLEFDEVGCARPDCGSDDECPADQRCTALPCVSTATCTQAPGGPCLCGGIQACFRGSNCTEVAQTGPRGEWTELEVTRTNTECGDGPNCTSWYRVGSEGGVAASRRGEPVSSALSPGDLADLRALIDGPELRVALRDGIACPFEVQDAVTVMRLTLTTGVLEREVAGCVEPVDAESIFKEVDAIASRH